MGKRCLTSTECKQWLISALLLFFGNFLHAEGEITFSPLNNSQKLDEVAEFIWDLNQEHWPKDEIETFLTAEGGSIWLAKRGNKVIAVGAAYTQLKDKKAINLVKFIVPPDEQKQGLGTALLNYIISDQQSRGRDTLYMEVDEYNLAAQLFLKDKFKARSHKSKDPVNGTILMVIKYGELPVSENREELLANHHEAKYLRNSGEETVPSIRVTDDRPTKTHIESPFQEIIEPFGAFDSEKPALNQTHPEDNIATSTQESFPAIASTKPAKSPWEVRLTDDRIQGLRIAQQFGGYLGLMSALGYGLYATDQSLVPLGTWAAALLGSATLMKFTNGQSMWKLPVHYRDTPPAGEIPPEQRRGFRAGVALGMLEGVCALGLKAIANGLVGQ